MKKKIVLIVLFLVVVSTGWILYNNFSQQQDKMTLYYGNVETRSVILGFRFLGIITDILKDEGEVVHKGEVVAKLDSLNLVHVKEELQAKLDAAKALLKKLKKGYRKEEIQEAQAQLDEAKANLNKIKDFHTRQKQLLQTKAISQSDYIVSLQNYKRAQALYNKAHAQYKLRKKGFRLEDIEIQAANLKALQANIKKIDTDIRDTLLKSPVDGVVLTRYKEPGSVTSPGERVLEIAKSDELWIRAYVDESHLGKIKPREKILIYSDVKKKPYRGTVGFISPVAEFTPKNIQTQKLRTDLVYKFRVIVQNPDDMLRQGMPVTLQIANE